MHADEIHRTMKLLLDSGEAQHIAEAEARFATYQLVIMVGSEIATSPTLQATLLTAVNTGVRCFPGGVLILGQLDVPVCLSGRPPTTLAAEVVALHGTPIEQWHPSFACLPHILLGTVPPPVIPAPVMQGTFDGWAGGIMPARDAHRLAEKQQCPLAGVLAGALGVAEAFQYVRGRHAHAGRRPIGLSLWRPDPDIDWLSPVATGPALQVLPARAWLIGLGHLGQAYLWAMGMLPYAHPEQVELVLQDDDMVTRANESTSLLLFDHRSLGKKKTRVVARWCEQRGFQTTLIERAFHGDEWVRGSDPGVAFCGVDNPQARAVLEDVGFVRIIEAGLGQGTQEYLDFQLHTFPAPSSPSAKQRWGSLIPPALDAHLLTQPAYQAMATEGIDPCGITLLAGRTIAASFVGAVVATLVIAEWIRIGMGEPGYALIDGSLQNLTYRSTISQTPLPLYNPGVTAILPAY
jgi:hypothetical protein